MTERRFDVEFHSGVRRLEVVESFLDDAGREVRVVRGWFPFHADADAELFCAVLRAVGGATAGWAEVIRENGLAMGEVEADYSDMSLWVQKAQDIPPFLMVNSAQEAAILAGALDRDAENWRWSDEMHPSVFAADQAAVARDLAERARCAVREWSARVMAQEGQHGS